MLYSPCPFWRDRKAFRHCFAEALRVRDGGALGRCGAALRYVFLRLRVADQRKTRRPSVGGVVDLAVGAGELFGRDEVRDVGAPRCGAPLPVHPPRPDFPLAHRILFPVRLPALVLELALPGWVEGWIDPEGPRLAPRLRHRALLEHARPVDVLALAGVGGARFDRAAAGVVARRTPRRVMDVSVRMITRRGVRRATRHAGVPRRQIWRILFADRRILVPHDDPLRQPARQRRREGGVAFTVDDRRTVLVQDLPVSP